MAFIFYSFYFLKLNFSHFSRRIPLQFRPIEGVHQTPGEPPEVRHDELVPNGGQLPDLQADAGRDGGEAKVGIAHRAED